uniref:Uncharacterized protein n=1 Tax=Cacopsylla melanoneura TaxID=428564 RepID=A0A8D8Z3D1_9HEMI
MAETVKKCILKGEIVCNILLGKKIQSLGTSCRYSSWYFLQKIFQNVRRSTECKLIQAIIYFNDYNMNFTVVTMKKSKSWKLKRTGILQKNNIVYINNMYVYFKTFKFLLGTKKQILLNNNEKLNKYIEKYS